MAVERNANVDLSGLEDAFEWLKARKNVLVGLVLVVILGFAVTAFIQRQARESAVQPWRPLFEAESLPWDAPSKELGQVASEKIRSREPEAYALYWTALRRCDEGDLPGALEQLTAFRSKYADHPVSKTSIPDESGSGATRPAIDHSIARTDRLQSWNAQHPVQTANPPPSTKASVTFVTDRGSIVFGLHLDVAPLSCASFMKAAPSLKDQFIAKVAPDRWVELGQTAAGTAIETTLFTEAFPPFETNTLSHFTGSVSFRQPPFSKGPFNADLRVTLVADLAEDGRSTVFAEVIEGLDLLKSLSKEERKADAPQVLAQPLRITEVKVNADGG